jgi:hypothetical protein
MHLNLSLKKWCFPQLEIKGNVSASRCIVIMDINRYYMFAGRACFRPVLGSLNLLIENKLYCGTGCRCYSNPTYPNNSSNLSPTTFNELSYNPNYQLTTCRPDPGQRKLITSKSQFALALLHPGKPGNQNQAGRSRRPHRDLKAGRQEPAQSKI